MEFRQINSSIQNLGENMNEVAIQYRIERIKDGVSLQSTHRLPFEPKGTLLKMREDLKTALWNMPYEQEQILYGTYSFVENGRRDVDVDNILIYNVQQGKNGSTVFQHLCRNGLILEKFKYPHSLEKDKQVPYQYFQQYTMVDKRKQQTYWNFNKLIISWEDIRIRTLYNDLVLYWKDIKDNHNRIYIAAKDDVKDEKYGMEIILYTNTEYNLAGKLKYMIDGITAAFHSHTGKDLSEISQRIAVKLSIPARDIADILIDSQYAVLGKRRLVWLFRKGIQWNPADDRFAFIKILIKPSADSYTRLSGKIFTVSQ